MSAQAVGWVYRFSPLRGAAFSVHLAIADSVNDQADYTFWMAQGTLARKARVSRATCQRAIDTLIDSGLLVLVAHGSGSTNLYRLVMPDDVTPSWEPRSKPQPAPKTKPLATPNPPHGEAGGCLTVRQGVPHGEAGGCLTVRQGVPHGEAGGCLTVRQGVPHGEAVTQVEPKGEPKGNLRTATDVDGRAIATAVWERKKEAGQPTPAQPFVAVAKIADALLSAGHQPARIIDAMVAVPTISTRWVEAELARRRPQRRAAVSEDRDAPEGRVVL